MNMKKIISVLLSTVLFASLFSGCSKTNVTTNSIMSNCGYFTSEKIEFGFPYDDDGEHIVASCDCKSHCVVDDSIFVIVDAIVGNPNASGEEPVQYTDIIEYSLIDGSILNVFDGEKLKESFKDVLPSKLQLASLYEEDGKIRVFAYEMLSGLSKYCLDSAILDTDSCKLTKIKRYEDITYDTMRYYQPGYTNNPIIRVDDRYVFPVYNYDSLTAVGMPGIFYVFNDEECLGSIDCTQLQLNDIYEAKQTYSVSQRDGNTYLGGCFYSYKNGRVDYELNIDSFVKMTINDSASSTSDETTNSHYAFVVNDSINMSVDKDGIYLLNSDNNEWEQKVDFNYADINLIEMSTSIPVYCKDNMIIVEPWSTDGKLSIIKIIGSEENPYENRTDITLASIYDDMDYATAEAIRRFNLDNQDYHISVRFYDYNKEVAGITALSNVSNMVLADMANGEAPDIILNAASMHEFNNSNYLLDLSPYLENEDYINDKCFSSIVNAAYSGNEIYQLPISFVVVGVKTVASANEDYSFDFDEYAKFVSEKCNGTDPIAFEVEGSRIDYFINLLRGDMDLFIDYDNISVNFDTPEFRTAADFVLNSYTIGDYSLGYSNLIDYIFNTVHDDEYGTFDIQYYMDENIRLKEPVHICGTPSVSGRGPMAHITASAAISVDCQSPDGAWEFIKYLYSQISNIPNNSYYAGLNHDTIETTVQYIIEERYSRIERERIFYDTTLLSGSFEDNLVLMRLFAINEDQIPAMMENLNAIDRVDCFDTDVMRIVYEEMPAYFKSQKTLDEVIEIINNRATLILEERG